MNITDLVTRFTFYATDSKDINYVAGNKKVSFMVCDPEAVAAAVTNGITFPCLVLQVPEFEKEGNIDNVVEHVECSFLVLNPVKISDFMGRMTNYDYCKGICDQITNHMIMDSYTYFPGGMVKTSEGKFGPLADSMYGWGVNFGFNQGFNAQIDPSRWRTA